jgi:hypothetical protein
MENSGDEVPNQGPLLNDPSREAVPTIRGYVYQNARTDLTWAELNVGEIPYVQGAEDLDRLGRVTESSQVKDYRRNITRVAMLDGVHLPKHRQCTQRGLARGLEQGLG